jgi:hypothetical protein
MDINIPLPALGIITLVGFFSPYAIAVVNQPFWPVWARRLVSVGVSLALAAISMVVYYILSSEPLPGNAAEWVTLGLVAIGVSQASYALVTKNTAAVVELKTTKP